MRLPISKSIANRILLLQAVHGDPLMRVSADMPDDVRVMHDALEQLQEYKKSPVTYHQSPLILHLKNCGTALRFLQVHLEKCYLGEPITLTGDDRLMERNGKPTSQTDSARILHGEDVPVTRNESPYITMSRRMAESYSVAGLTTQWSAERCWSSAAFWYEYVAIHGGDLVLEGLTRDTLQGDKAVAQLYNKHFGVITSYSKDEVKISKSSRPLHNPDPLVIDFTNIPDLYPAVALTCERLKINLKATGTERLRFKESNRLQAVRLHEVRNDHRMAMALMAADFPVSESDQKCIAKSYPGFAEILQAITSESRRSTDGQPTIKAKVGTPTISHVTPIRGVNDDNLGKKHALSKLIHSVKTEYIWLHDDDVILPPASYSPQGGLTTQWSNSVSGLSAAGGLTGVADLVILPLIMESESEKPSLLELLQIAEYAAIQELTMRTAKRGHAVMCSGANLIVRREVWLKCEKELHPEIPSGDDMFLLEAAKRHAYTVTAIDDPAYTAVVRPLTSWKAFFRQRMRWAGKAPHYIDRDIRRCGALVAIANILQLLCPLIILIKFPIEYSLIRKRERIFNFQFSIFNFLVSLLLEILYPFYLLICLIGGLFRKSW